MSGLGLMPLFAVPVYANNLGEPSNDLNQLIKTLPYQKMSSGTASVSESADLLELPELEYIRQKILTELHRYLNMLGLGDRQEFYLNRSWSLRLRPGDHYPRQLHRNSMISGIYHVETREDHGSMVFENPNTNLFSHTIDVDYKDYNIFNSQVWRIKPKPGDILLWPSQVPHSTDVNNGNTAGYSLAFNFFVRGQSGSHISHLSI